MGREEMRFIGGYQIQPEIMEETEELFHIHLPETFKKIALLHTEGFPEKGSFLCQLTSGEIMISYFGGIIDYNPNHSYPLSEVIKNIQLDYGIIPFGRTGFGDFMCFDYRNDPKTDNPPVVYWAHEFEENEGISFLAKDFDAFLDMLMSDEEAEAALEKLNNKP